MQGKETVGCPSLALQRCLPKRLYQPAEPLAKVHLVGLSRSLVRHFEIAEEKIQPAKTGVRDPESFESAGGGEHRKAFVLECSCHHIADLPLIGNYQDGRQNRTSCSGLRNQPGLDGPGY